MFVALLHGTIWFRVNLVSSVFLFALMTIVIKDRLSSHCCVCTQVVLRLSGDSRVERYMPSGFRVVVQYCFVDPM